MVACRSSLLFFLTAAFTVQAGREDSQMRGHAENTDKISPTLSPKSDKKFFGRDYPEDRRPGRIHKFDHPFPTVQDSEDYDTDFVKDENNERGEGSAQIDYDILKTKLQKMKAGLRPLKKKMEEEKKEWLDAVEREKAAEAASNAAEANAEDLQEALSDTGDVSGTSGAAEKVQDEVADLKKCEEELAKVKAELKKLMDKIADAEAKADDAAADADVAEDASEAAEKKESEWEEKVKKEKQDVAKARTAYEKKLAEFKTLEKQLDVAARKLSKIRNKEDCSGGILNCHVEGERSSSRGAALHSVAFFLFATSLM